MKILVVDDEKLLVKGIRFNLENEGYDVITGADGMEAVSYTHLLRSRDRRPQYKNPAHAGRCAPEAYKDALTHDQRKHRRHDLHFTIELRKVFQEIRRGGRLCPPCKLQFRNAIPIGKFVGAQGRTEASAPTRVNLLKFYFHLQKI